MSELMVAAGAIAPFAGQFATVLLQTFQQRAAESALDRGRQLFDRAIGRRAEEAGAGRTPAADSARAAVQALTDEDRQLLLCAIGEWAEDQQDLTAGALVRRVEEAEAARSGGDTLHTTSYGDGAPAIGKIVGGAHFHHTRTDSPSTGQG